MPKTSEPDFLHFDDAMTLEQRQAVREVLKRRGSARRTQYRRVVFLRLRRALQSIVASGGRAAWSVGAGLAAFLVRRWRTYVVEWRRLRDVARLHAMSDRDLKDIGVPRSEIDWATRYGRSHPHTGPWRAGRLCEISHAVPIAPRESSVPVNAAAVRKRAA